MDPGIRVDLHLHSNCSDGVCTPAAIAQRLAAAGVTHAAITDHNNLDAQEPFRRAFDLHGGIAITGLETCARFEDQLVHLLVYGFDPMDSSIRSLVEGALPLEKALHAIHQGQGLAVLAHPLHFWHQRDDLSRVLGIMKAMGLDGTEACYKPYPLRQQQVLLDLADEHGLLVSAGSDYHGHAIDGGIEPGVDFDLSRWQQFRNGLSVFRMAAEERPAQQSAEGRMASGRPDWRWLALRIIVPAIVTVGLFVGAIFGLILPAFEQNLLERKRETIRELTNSAWSILEGYQKEVAQGRLSDQEARQMASERIRFMRYGNQGKDYFWITDMQPLMIMHPYRTDLEGQDVSDFTDPRGVKLFVEFVNAVRERQHDYVGYVWQWKDDPERLAPKESYVRLFEPWGWIIGTGLYTDDVHAEIAAHERRLIDLSLVIVGLITLLLLSMVFQSVRIERHRSQASLQLRESHEKYRALIEATTEGNLMLLGRRCGYANQAMLEMIGYNEQIGRASCRERV